MKYVLFTAHRFELNGVSGFIRQYSEVLIAHHITPIILAFRGDIDNEKAFFPGCRIVKISPVLNSSTGLFRKINELSLYISSLHTVFQNYGADILCIHFSTVYSTMMSLCYPPVWLKKRVITFYGPEHLEYLTRSEVFGKSALFKWLYSKKIKLFQTFCLRFSQRVVVFSGYAMSVLRYEYPHNIYQKAVVIPGFVKKVHQRQSRKIRKKLQIVNIGRAEGRKGVDVLFHALKILQKKHILFQCVISSPISYYIWTDLYLLYEKLNLFADLLLLHKSDERQKRGLLLQADVFVIPSIALETFGMTIIEALSYGVPVIGTPIGSIPEILSKVDKRLIAKNTTSESIADVLCWYQRLSTHERTELSHKCVQIVSTYYLKQAVEEKMLSLYGFPE